MGIEVGPLVFHAMSNSNRAPREVGTVKWFNKIRGFGFVIRHDRSEIFAHSKDVRREKNGSLSVQLKPDIEVEFSVSQGPKGLCATDITKCANPAEHC